MPGNSRIVADSIQQFTDSILKWSAALLIVPVVFLRFVAEVGPSSHPDALLGVYPVESVLKIGIFGSLGLSITLGLLVKCLLIHQLNAGSLECCGSVPRKMVFLIWASGIGFLVGLLFLMYLFYQFPIDIPEPFRLDRSHLG